MELEILRAEGGFGIIPRNVMRSELTIQAKTLYCYLQSFAGDKGYAYPSTTLMAKELGITRNTLHKYIKELEDNGYIFIEKQRGDDGKFAKNVYHISFTPCIKKPYTAEPYTAEPYTDNQYTNNNSINNNSINNNSNNTSSDGGISNDDLQTIIEKWNSIGLNQVEKVSSNSTLKSYINARVKENSLEEVLNMIDRVPKNKLLMGEATDWRCSFDWIMKKSNFEKVQRNTYPPNRKGINNGEHQQFVYDDGSGDKEDDRPSPADILRRAIEEAERESEERNE